MAVKVDKATRLVRAINREQRKLEALMVARDKAAKAELMAWDDQFAQAMYAAKVSRDAAVASWRDFRVAMSLKKNRAIIGRQVVEWVYEFLPDRRSYRPTGRRGVVEVWNGTKVSGDVDCGIPGCLVVREIRRGKLSGIVDLYGQEWVTAGVRHKGANPSVESSSYAAVAVVAVVARKSK